MRLFSIRRARIDPGLRATFEQHGVTTMQVLLAAGDYFRQKEKPILVKDAEAPLLLWLTEQYDRAERKEHWTVVMEGAITLFVATELLLSLCR